MSRPAAAVNPGKTNRRFVMLAIVLGLLGAIIVYVSFSRSSSSGGPSGNNVPVVVANQDIPARTKITDSMVEVRLIPSDNRSALGYTDVAAVVGQVTRFPITQNEQVLSSKVVLLSPAAGSNAGAATASRSLSFVVPQGMRGLAVTTKPVTGAGGLVIPGDFVDILVVYSPEFPTSQTDPTQRQKAENYVVQTLIQNVQVLAVSQVVVDTVPDASASSDALPVRNTEAKPDPGAVTVTLAVTPEDAQKVYLAESNGQIRFSERHFGDAEQRPLTPMVAPDLFRSLPNPYLVR